MKNYLVIPQEDKNWCLSSCLQAIFKFHNIEFSQKEITNKLTPFENGFCPRDGKIKMLFKEKNFDYSWFDYFQPPYERDFLIQEMDKENSHGIIGIQGHMYLLKHFKDPYLKLIDPKDTSVFDIDIFNLFNKMGSSARNRKTFFSNSYEIGEESGFGLITKL